ncbi:MAG TPA: glycosyltransferase family 39 protein [Candidatus Binataceae bacterium]|nr:glycosyltransferase family 39 protein [Candidatus Binataceae bacterium]
MKRAGMIAAGVIGGWFILVWLVIRPITDGPVVDSWIYAESVRWFIRTGEIRFAGYTQAMPAAQVIWGASWATLFGASAASLELSTALLAALTAIMFYALAIRCGARRWQAFAGAALIACNPCFLFLGFSFMTEVPFLAALVASHLAFANATGEHEYRWLWIAAIAGAISFAVRPFGGIAIAGAAGAIVFEEWRRPRRDFAGLATKLTPFAVTTGFCAIYWIYFTIVRTPPWSLRLNESHLPYLFAVPFAEYLRSGVLNPLLWIGIAVSPIALGELVGGRTARIIGWAVALYAAAALLIRINPALPATPELSCFGGCANALQLHGLPNRFHWTGWGQWAAMAIGSIGAGAFIEGARGAMRRLSRPALAVLIAAALYFAVSIPLWMFNDRYDLAMLPAACLIVALAPIPNRIAVRALTFIAIAIMGLLSMGGVYAYQRGLAAVMAERDRLLQADVPRRAIDAGYELNGLDLYRFPEKGEDEFRDERGIPMITTAKIDEFTIASRVLPGTIIVRRFAWPGTFGIGSRELYVLKKNTTARPISSSATSEEPGR